MTALWLALPQWARTGLMWTGGIIMLLVTGKFLLARRDDAIRKDARHDAELQQERQINSQREEAQERVDAFEDASRAVERLPDAELRERSETDPNNRGRVRRD